MSEQIEQRLNYPPSYTGEGNIKVAGLQVSIGGADPLYLSSISRNLHMVPSKARLLMNNKRK